MLTMGCAESHLSTGPNHHHRCPKHAPSSTFYDWDKENGGYIPYRFQGAHRRRWRREDKEAYAQQVRDAAERERNRQALLKHNDANGEKARLRKHYNEQVGRKRAEAYGQEVRDAAERERNRQALGFYDVHENKGKLRRPRDEEECRRKAARAKREKIRVYASPGLTARWGG